MRRGGAAAENPQSGGEEEPAPPAGMPAMDGELQGSCDKYVKPLVYSNFFSGNYSSEPLSADWGEAGIITIYQELAGSEVWPGLVDDKYQVAAAEVESLLALYFPFDAKTVQELAGTAYDEEAGAYTMVERGGSPREAVVTKNVLSDEDGEGRGLLEIDYDLYGPGEADGMEKFAGGKMQIELLEDGRFCYINNEMQFD